MLIRARNLQKVYPTRRQGTINALENVNLDIREGEFVSIVGPSGCGKTTLLKILGGIIRPTTGIVESLGNREIPPGIVFQRPVLLPWRTVLENVMLPVYTLKLNRKEHEDKAHELLELMGLRAFESAYPAELSGGMQQRASIVRALIYGADLLLMDEPFGALDALTRDRLNVELQTISVRTNKTIVFVTHSIPEAVFLGDRVVVMSRRPATIKCDVTIDVPRTRSLGDLGSDALGRYVNEIRGTIDAEDR